MRQSPCGLDDSSFVSAVCPASFISWHNTQLVFGRLRLVPAEQRGLHCHGSNYSAEEHRVDPNSARQVLEDVLSSWKAGEAPEQWQQRKPPVVVQDMDWKNGALLESFEIKESGEAIDANLHCQVKLKLQMPNSTKSEKTVTYLVGTSPVVTVFRALGP